MIASESSIQYGPEIDYDMKLPRLSFLYQQEDSRGKQVVRYAATNRHQ